ncbi:MAG: GNAT family N-acetyltransferase [Armatimonadota bacterium]
MSGPEVNGEKVVLRPLRDQDLENRVQWMNDPETSRLFTGAVPVRNYELTDACRWRENTEMDTKTIVWAIDASDGNHIGDVDLHGIDTRFYTAKLTILIGCKKYWNSGYGTDTIRTLLKYAFTVQRLRSVYLKVFVFNKRAIRCYEKCGFTEISVATDTMVDIHRPAEIHMMISKNAFILDEVNGNTFHA